METHYEIEYKYTVNPKEINYQNYPYDEIEQAYLSTSPVIRIRKRNKNFFLTVKGKGLVKREEFELTISSEEYNTLKAKAEGHVITKRRYLIPYRLSNHNYTIELDVFSGNLSGLFLAEVEFSREEEAKFFVPPHWFLENVSSNKKYHNSFLAKFGKN